VSATAAPVLVAVDFSPDSDSAFGWAVAAALAFDAPLLVLHVAHDPAAAPGTYVRSDEPMTELEEAAEQMLDERVERLRKEFPQTGELSRLIPRVVVGLPVGRILEVAEQEGAQLIVMGGQGRSGLADALLGSKVERVARTATIPVTIVRAPKADPTSVPSPPPDEEPR
jgi:nucleotide-binding universal stress UspA family protein